MASRGRPVNPDSKSNADRQREFRARKVQRISVTTSSAFAADRGDLISVTPRSGLPADRGVSSSVVTEMRRYDLPDHYAHLVEFYSPNCRSWYVGIDQLDMDICGPYSRLPP